MKKSHFLALTLSLSIALPTLQAAPLGTAFTYQGQLKNGGSPAGGNFNMVFKLWDDSTLTAPANQVGPTLTFDGAGGNPPPISVTNGLFTVQLDFGASALDGNKRWLEVTVSGATLSPRQELTAAPYAQQASGITPSPLSQEIAVGNQRALRLEFAQYLGAPAPNVIGGFAGNLVQSGMGGATIGGGGGAGFENRVMAEFGTVSGGYGNMASGQFSTVGGGLQNTASGYGSTVGGGDPNNASGLGSTIAGGKNNTASGNYSAVGGGESNVASGGIGGHTTVAGGFSNTASGPYSTVGGGWSNTATLDFATTAGGDHNSATGTYSAIGGGTQNSASSQASTVAGGDHNTASGLWSTVPGGYTNLAQGVMSFAAGYTAQALHDGAWVWADYQNGVGAVFPSTGADQFLIRATGGVGIGTNSPAQALDVAISNPGVNSVCLLENKNATAGSQVRLNLGRGGDVGTGAYKGLVLGADNASSFMIDNEARPMRFFTGTVGGNPPAGNAAERMRITNDGNVGIGIVPTQKLHVVGNQILFQNAAQTKSITLRTDGGELDISGGGARLFISAGNDLVLNGGGGDVGIRNTNPGFPLHVGTDATNGNGAHVTIGGVWTNGSDRNSKKDFEPIDKLAILAKVTALPVTQWRYKSEPESLHHIGPMAQDFYSAFQLGGSDRHIGTLDAEGVALVAIQGLHQIVKEKDAEIAELKCRLDRMEAAIERMANDQNGGVR